MEQWAWLAKVYEKWKLGRPWLSWHVRVLEAL